MKRAGTAVVAVLSRPEKCCAFLCAGRLDAALFRPVAGYNIVSEFFEENDAVLLGISVDNLPMLFSWTNQMGRLWFEMLSDFWPHGAVASRYGSLRSDGTAERAIIIIDKKGILRYIDVHDINERPLPWKASSCSLKH